MKKVKDIDPLDGFEGAGERVEQTTGKKQKDSGRKIVRIEDLEKRLDNGEGISADEIVSTYMPHRKARIFGAALLRLSRVKLIFLGLALLIVILFALSLFQDKMGNFTINLDRLELFRKGISISADPMFSEYGARLVAESITDATNITWTDIPDDINMKNGSNNGRSYMAYTYYVRNAGKEDLAYDAVIKLDSSAKGAEKAARVAVWNHETCTLYAAPASDGSAEPGCESFESDEIVCKMREETFNVGYVNKYTIVIWLEGEDPECVDDIVGGSMEFSMEIVSASDDDDTTILEKLVMDISDFLTGNQPISAAGEDAPNYSGEGINWETRLNK